MSTPNPVEYDVFVSYAHADNERNWVQSVVELLRIKVNEALGRKARIFFDPQIPIGTRVSQELVESVSASGILLVVLSPSYLASDWCAKERQQFLAKRITTERNIFVIEADKVSREKWPPELADLETREMWDTTSTPPLRLDPNLGREYEARFTRCVYEIGYAIADRLQMFEPAPAPATKGAVWIAPVTADLRQQRLQLAEMVRQAGWSVLPQTQYKRDDCAAFETALRDDLGQAKLFVQLFGPWSGENPDWHTSSFPVLHANAAREIAKERDVRWLRWRTKDAKATTDADDYRALVNEGGVQEGTPGDFAAEVIRCLKLLSNPPHQPKPKIVKSGSSDEAVIVYIKNDDVDRELAKDIQDSLLMMNVDIMAAPDPSPDDDEESPASRRKKEAAPVPFCDGVILVHGKTAASWVQSQYSNLRKAFSKNRPNGLIGLYKAPPPPKNDVVVSRAVHPIDCQKGFEAERLADFIARLREQQNREDDNA